MTDEVKKQTRDERPSYEPPRVLRMVDTHPGVGIVAICFGDGSGDFQCTSDGNGAAFAGGCTQPGSSAWSCGFPGSDAPTLCYQPGNTPD